MGKSMRLRSLIPLVAAGLAVAWWYENLAAAYVAIFGSLILRGLRIVQFNVDPVSSARAASSEPQASNAVKDPASSLILQRRAAVEKLGKSSDPRRRSALQLELAKIDEALLVLGFVPARTSTDAAQQDEEIVRPQGLRSS
jgi:hypothetical protein